MLGLCCCLSFSLRTWGLLIEEASFVAGFPGGTAVKNPPANAGGWGSIRGSGRSPGEGNGNPPPYSCLENPTNRGDSWAIVPGVTRSWTGLNTHYYIIILLLAKYRLVGRQASVVAAPGLWRTGSIVVAHGLNCSVACGIFPDQGSNLCLLDWKADSLTLSHQGSSFNLFLNWSIVELQCVKFCCVAKWLSYTNV